MLFLKFLPASTQLTLDFCRRLDSIVGPQLTVLASDICEQFNINKRISGFVSFLPHAYSHTLTALVKWQWLSLKSVGRVNTAAFPQALESSDLLFSPICDVPRKGKGMSPFEFHFTSVVEAAAAYHTFHWRQWTVFPTVSCSPMANYLTWNTHSSPALLVS